MQNTDTLTQRKLCDLTPREFCLFDEIAKACGHESGIEVGNAHKLWDLPLREAFGIITNCTID